MNIAFAFKKQQYFLITYYEKSPWLIKFMLFLLPQSPPRV